MPARADASWGSDRADSLAEEAHRSAYAPPATPAASRPRCRRGHAAAVRPRPSDARPSAAAAAGETAYVGSVPHAPASGRPRPRTAAPCRRPASPLDRPAGAVRAAAGAARWSSPSSALCLLSGVIGGVAGQLAEDRINVAGSTLPEPGPGRHAATGRLGRQHRRRRPPERRDDQGRRRQRGIGDRFRLRHRLQGPRPDEQPRRRARRQRRHRDRAEQRRHREGDDRRARRELRPRRAQDQPHRPQAPHRSARPTRSSSATRSSPSVRRSASTRPSPPASSARSTGP